MPDSKTRELRASFSAACAGPSQSVNSSRTAPGWACIERYSPVELFSVIVKMLLCTNLCLQSVPYFAQNEHSQARPPIYSQRGYFRISWQLLRYFTELKAYMYYNNVEQVRNITYNSYVCRKPNLACDKHMNYQSFKLKY